MNQNNPYQAPQSDVAAQHHQAVYDKTSPFSPAGRFGRLRYFAYSTGFNTALMFAILLFTGLLSTISQELMAVATSIALLAYLIIIVFSFIFMIKRLHDLDWSGWLVLLMLIPLVNIVIGCILLFMPGTPGENRYGPPPKPGKNVVWVIVLVLFLIAVIGVLAAIAVPAYQDYVKRAQQASMQME